MLLKLGDAADAHNLLEVRGHPQRNRRSPESVAGDAPISGLCQPVVEALLLHKGWHPVRLIVVLDQLLAHLLHLDEPARDRPVDQGSVRPPAVRVVVHLHSIEDKLAFLFQLLLDVFVCLFHMLALEVRHLLSEAPVVINGADHASSILLYDAGAKTHPIVVLAKGRSLVHNARASIRGDVAIGHDLPRRLQGLSLEVVEERLVLEAFQLLPRLLPNHLEILLGVLLDGGADPWPAVLAHDPLGSRGHALDLKVRELGVHTERHVGGQGPGSGRPGEDVGILLVFELELHNDGWIRDFLVVLGDLEVRQRRGAGSAVGHDSEGPVDHAFVKELLEDPPTTLHKALVHRLVVVVEVNPAPESLHNPLPLSRVALHNAAALFVVGGDAHLDDILMSLHVQLLVDLIFDRKPMAIPTEPSLHMVAPLMGISCDDILDSARKYVAVVGEAGREGRAIIEVVRRLALRLPD
mmetsp:Transcript_15121/g.35756  ORF Transcript_15121/g.35756 Transcript_15121/m.35756 type:complete len:466 (-) Transcript_15121:239-1636(-)